MRILELTFHLVNCRQQLKFTVAKTAAGPFAGVKGTLEARKSTSLLLVLLFAFLKCREYLQNALCSFRAMRVLHFLTKNKETATSLP